MNEHQRNHADQSPPSVKGLPMFTASAPKTLSREKAQLRELDKRGFLRRWQGYFQLTGPGWLQSALTLGGLAFRR
jgi:hypothetical protein